MTRSPIELFYTAENTEMRDEGKPVIPALRREKIGEAPRAVYKSLKQRRRRKATCNTSPAEIDAQDLSRGNSK